MIKLTFLKKVMFIIQNTSESKESHICDYWYFLDKGFKFQPDVCDGCHDVLMMSVNLRNTAISNIKGAGYHCIVSWQ